MYEFDFKNTIKRLLHPFYRSKKNIAWLMVLLSYLRGLKQDFVDFKNRTQYNISFNSQKLSMEARLNQEYNLVMGTIYIETVSTNDDSVYLFWLSENQRPTYTYWISETNVQPIYTRWISEPSPTGTNIEFIVYIPNNLIVDLNRLKAIINLYKLAGKRYAIQTY